MEVAQFDWLDYTVFGIMLSISIMIGIFFGCFGTKQKSVNEYLFGGKDMKTIPVGLSLVASLVSGFTLISVPAEAYTDGFTYWLMTIAGFLSCIFTYYFIIPVFYELQITTAYEYLERRFNKSVRRIASFYYTISILIYMPSIIYVPSLTLNQVTGINMYIITIGMTAVCVFYTLIGGLKAVVWTDFLQITIAIVACFAIAIIGSINAGGFSHVFETGYEDGRLDIFRMDPNPFIRSTFWTSIIGGFTTLIVMMGIGQSYVQRYLSLPSKHEVKKALIIFGLGYFFVLTCGMYSGIIVYVSYYGCDPVEQKVISKYDQIFPYYIMDKIGNVPILPGLYVAGVFGAALSTLSTGLNTVAGIIYEDYIKNKIEKTEFAHLYMKSIIITMGIFWIGMVFVVEKLGRILSLTITITSLTNAPILTLFVMGLMIPISNSKGAIASVISSTAFLGWIIIGSTVSKINLKPIQIYPEGINRCSDYNITQIHTDEPNVTLSLAAEEDDVFILYELSFLHYVNFGLIAGLIVGVITSYATGPTDPTLLDPQLISPPLRRFLPKKSCEQIKSEEKFVL